MTSRPSVAGGLVLAGGRGIVTFAATPYGPAQEFRLLVDLLHRLASAGLAAAFGCQLGLALDRLGAVVTLPVPIVAAIPVAVAAMVAPIRAVMPILAMIALVTVVAALRVSLPLWLRQRLRKALVGEVFAVLLDTEFLSIGTLARSPHAQALTIAVQITGLMHLLAIRHDNPAVMLRMLQIVFRKHWIAGGLRVARQRKVFFGDVRRCAPDFNVRAIRLKATRERVLTLAVTAATAAILLSLPHCLIGSHNKLGSIFANPISASADMVLTHLAHTHGVIRELPRFTARA